MQIQEFEIPDLKLIKLKSFGDSRGFFVERFKRSLFTEMNLPIEFVQDNFSKSSRGVLRGLHYQWDQPQGKLVTVTRGKIFDVALDIRHGSPSFGKYQTVELSGDEPAWFWIPPGFAHGFCVVSEDADLLYKCTTEYNPKGESGILWNDPQLNIPWVCTNPILSPRDTGMPEFSEYQKAPKLHFRGRK